MDWQRAIDAFSDWSKMEPTSVQPMIQGSFIALVALEDGKQGLKILDKALQLNTENNLILNNLAVAHAYNGDTQEAEKKINRINYAKADDISRITNMATKGLIEYRKGNLKKGRELYSQALDMEIKENDNETKELVRWHILREEATIGSHQAQQYADKLYSIYNKDANRIKEIDALYKGIKEKVSTKNHHGQEIPPLPDSITEKL